MKGSHYEVSITVYYGHTEWGEKNESNNHVETHKFLQGRDFLFFERYDVVCDLINTATHKNEMYLLNIKLYTVLVIS